MEETAILVNQLRRAWLKVLPDTEISDDTSFFVVGGDSMLGSMLMQALSELTKQDFTLADLYENPTFGKLLDLISRASGNR